jgi:hypothetical protein
MPSAIAFMPMLCASPIIISTVSDVARTDCIPRMWYRSAMHAQGTRATTPRR